MEYHGKLYGRIGKKYFDTSYTTKDWDVMVKRIEYLEKALELKKPNGVNCNFCGKLFSNKIDCDNHYISEHSRE